MPSISLMSTGQQRIVAAGYELEMMPAWLGWAEDVTKYAGVAARSGYNYSQESRECHWPAHQGEGAVRGTRAGAAFQLTAQSGEPAMSTSLKTRYTQNQRQTGGLSLS